MRIAVLVVFAMLVLGGGGAAAYFYFKQPAEASIGETEEHTAAKEVQHGGGHGGAKESAGHEFVELSPLVLPIVDSSGVTQTVSIVVVIEVEGSGNAGLVTSLEPRLKDAYIQDLYGVLNRHAALKGGVLQVQVIKDRLLQISNRVMGEGVVQDVLLQVVQQRPI